MSKVYKWCVVPQCCNTSIKTPSKLFVYVPNNVTMRNKWLNLARRDPNALSVNSAIYFCEDHFDLPNDMENYMEYKIMGTVKKIRMRPGCMPSKFNCKAIKKKCVPSSSTLTSPMFRKPATVFIQKAETPVKLITNRKESSVPVSENRIAVSPSLHRTELLYMSGKKATQTDATSTKDKAVQMLETTLKHESVQAGVLQIG